jgi:hypothetical protein
VSLVDEDVGMAVGRREYQGFGGSSWLSVFSRCFDEEENDEMTTCSPVFGRTFITALQQTPKLLLGPLRRPPFSKSSIKSLSFLMESLR